MKVSLEEIMSALSPAQQAALEKGAAVETAHGMLLPVKAPVPGCSEPLQMVVLSRVTPEVMVGAHNQKQAFKLALAELSMTTVDRPELLAVVDKTLKSWRSFEESNEAVISMIAEDYLNLVGGYAHLPRISKKMEMSEAARARVAKDPKSHAMIEIKLEWDRWQRREVNYAGDADFGRKMHLKHPEFLTDRSIAQRSAKWRNDPADTSS